MARHHIAYVSASCPASQRFIDIVRSSERASNEIRLVDIAEISQQELARLQVVPTLQLRSGQVLVGGKAFEFLQQTYEDDLPMTNYEFASGGLMFADVEASSGMAGATAQRTMPFEKF